MDDTVETIVIDDLSDFEEPDEVVATPYIPHLKTETDQIDDPDPTIEYTDSEMFVSSDFQPATKAANIINVNTSIGPLKLVPLEKLQDRYPNISIGVTTSNENSRSSSASTAEPMGETNFEEFLTPEVLDKRSIRAGGAGAVAGSGVKRKRTKLTPDVTMTEETYNETEVDHKSLVQQNAWLRVSLNFMLERYGFTPIEFQSSVNKTRPLEKVETMLYGGSQKMQKPGSSSSETQ